MSLLLIGASLCLSFPFSLWTDLLSPASRGQSGWATNPQTTGGPDVHHVWLLPFPEKETEAQGGEGTGPRSHSEMLVKQVSAPEAHPQPHGL